MTVAPGTEKQKHKMMPRDVLERFVKDRDGCGKCENKDIKQFRIKRKGGNHFVIRCLKCKTDWHIESLVEQMQTA